VEGIDSVPPDGAYSEVSMEGVEEALFENGMPCTYPNGMAGHAETPGAVGSIANGTASLSTGSSSMLLAQGQVILPNVKQEKTLAAGCTEHNLRYGENEFSEESLTGGVVCTDVVSRARKVLQQRGHRKNGRNLGRVSPSSSSSPPSSPGSPLEDGDNDRYQLATSSSQGKQITSKVGGHTFMDITPYMTLPQAEAARRLGIPPSTLSKRWRVAARKRKWPWRVVSKLDKEITTLMYNITPGETLDKEVEERLAYLMARRQKELRPVSIRI